MRPGKIGSSWAARFACAALALIAFSAGAGAGTTGKLSGRLLDEKNQPLTGVNVAIPAARLGAITDAEGRYSVLNVPAGTYDVRFSLIGYGTVTFREVVISSDQITALDATLEAAPLPMKEVVVTARRPVVDVNLTSNIATVSREQIKNLPVQELADVVNLQAGVVEGHFRGGRIGEVQYQVDGVTVNNVFNNTAGLKLDRSLLEEVQVISGTFDAEYGQAMSGVVNAVLRRGTERYEASGELLSGAFVYPGTDRLQEYEFRPSAIRNYQLTLSGPTRLPHTVFLLSGRRYASDDYVLGRRVFLPTDRVDSLGGYHPTGDQKKVSLAYTREWSGVAKLTNRSIPNVEVNYQALFDQIDGRRSNYRFFFIPDALPKQRTISVVHGIDWTHTLAQSTYYRLSARQNYIGYRDMVYEDLYDPRYDAAGGLGSDPNVALGAFTQGVDFTRFRQKTNTLVLGGSFVSQVRRDHLVKVGGELQLPRLDFGNPGHLTFSLEGGRERLVRHENEPPDFPGIQRYWPVLGAAFAQDQVEWSDLLLRAGLRLEYFDARATLPSDLMNPANAIEGAPPSHPRRASRKVSLMPRVGVSYPITSKASVFFAYGHFTQMPPLGDVFTNADYTALNQLAAGGVDYGTLGNPDMRPEKTVQYQFGYKQALADWLGLDLNVFYKDIRDLLGVEFISTYNDAEYARLTNVDFGNVLGFTLTVDQRDFGPLSTTLDYTWQTAQGNSSDPRETATRAEAGEDPRPRQVPLNWDQRHTFNLTARVSRPEHYSVSAILRVASGQPYTPTVTTVFGGGLATNSGRKPTAVVADVRAEKNVALGALGASLFCRVFNVFDTRFFNGFVFATTGSPYYSFSPGDREALVDPTRFYGPRRIEVGMTFRGGEAR